MAQRPTQDFNIDPNVTSGTDLANILNRFQDAIDSGNSGASRPAYLDAGGLWVREGDPMRLYLYDGTTDRELYNTTDGLVGASQWQDNGDDIYYAVGNVGIGTNDPKAKLHIQDGKFEVRNSTGPAVMSLADQTSGFCSAEISATSTGNNKSDLTFYTKEGVSGLLPRLTIDAAGNVGIGNPDSGEKLSVEGGNIHLRTAYDQYGLTNAYMYFQSRENGNWRNSYIGAEGNNLVFATGGTGTDHTASNARLTISPTGLVGIGMTPDVRTAKEQLADWKSQFDARLKTDPKADKKAVTLEITDDAFEVLPTEDKLAEWMETRAAGDKLQVAGNATFSGTVDAGGFTVNGSPLTRVSDLIETLSTLRTATQDETTLEGLRDAIGNAVGGLIEKFEAIQAEAEKAATMDIEE